MIKAVVSLLLVTVVLVSAGAPPNPKAVDCGQTGLIWTKTWNLDQPNKNWLVAVDSATLKVVFNWTWTDATNFLSSAYDVTTGLLVFYGPPVTLQYYNTKTRKFTTNEVSLSLDNALDIWFDNQGTLWALYFDPQNDKQYLWTNVDLGTGSVSPRWTSPNPSYGLLADDASFDFATNTYYFNDGNKPNTLWSMNVFTGKATKLAVAEIDASTFISGGNVILGELGSNSSLVSLSTTTLKITELYNKPPYLTSDNTALFDKATNSYILQVLNDGPEIYYWWAYDLSTNQVRQENSSEMFMGAHLCPAKV